MQEIKFSVKLLLQIFCIFTFGVNLIQTSKDATQADIINYGVCLTPKQDRGLCVELEECKSLHNMLLSYPASADAAFITKSQCGFINKKVLVCCANRDLDIKLVNTDSRLNANDKNLLPQPGVCGRVLWNNRIVGGKITKIDEFPWMALIEYTKPGDFKGHHCGGSLINTRYVITAAHCYKSKILPVEWKISAVRLGDWDREKNPDCDSTDCAKPYVEIPVEKIIPHPGYDINAKNKLNDIALLRLQHEVTYTDFVRPICLPIKQYLHHETFIGIVMDVAGWGRTEHRVPSRYKLKAEVTVKDWDACRDIYNTHGIYLSNAQMCAGGERDVDSCNGDSGGPLIGLDITNPDRHYHFLAGIISFGPTECGLEGWPGVYTRVGHYIKWIQETIQP